MNKIRILYIAIDSSLGGSTASLYNLIDGVKEYVEPIVLFPEHGVGVEYYITNGIESYVYPYITLLDYKANKFIDNWMHIWRWHYIHKLRKDYKCYAFVKKMLAGRNVDIVHSNTSPNDIGVLLASKLHAKHIWHVRESCDYFEIYRGIPRLRKLINNSDARIAISSAIKKHWQMPDKNTWVINDAIRKQEDACYIPNKGKYLLFSSYYLTEFKGARFAIQAFGLSGMAKDGYRLKLMGNCEENYYVSLCETAQAYGVIDYIDFVPCQKDVKTYYAHATAFIMASEYEGLGRVTAEAMFYGCPVIAHAVGGTLDIVKDGETGYLFNSLEECAEQIKLVCSENQQDIIIKAQDYAINNLSQEAYAPKIMQVYNSMLN